MQACIDTVAAVDFDACVDQRVECRVCLILDAMDNLGRDCDTFDDGAANLSCASLPETTTTTSTSTTMPAIPDWGLGCFTTEDCGSAHCPSFGPQCTDYIESIGLMAGSEMCFYDCMDSGLKDVTDCRDDCGGSPPSGCDTTTAGAGGFDGVVTGAGKCTPSGFSASSVTLGGTVGLLKRVLVDFSTSIDESSLFSSAPPACPAMCPATGSACDTGAPYSATPLADVFRLQIGDPLVAPEVCERLGLATTVCKYSPTGYAFVLTPTGFSTASFVEVTMFMSCHVTAGGGTTFLHHSTGDFYTTGGWPP